MNDYYQRNLNYVNSLRTPKGGVDRRMMAILRMPSNCPKTGWIRRLAMLPYVLESATTEQLDKFWSDDAVPKPSGMRYSSVEDLLRKTAPSALPGFFKAGTDAQMDEIISALTAIYDLVEMLADSQDARVLRLGEAIQNLTNLHTKEGVCHGCGNPAEGKDIWCEKCRPY